jgi:HEAT repeat protein
VIFDKTFLMFLRLSTAFILCLWFPACCRVSEPEGPEKDSSGEIAMCKAESPDEKLASPGNAKPGSESSELIERLLAKLKSPDVDKRRSAAEDLAEFGDAPAIPSLIEAMQDEDDEVRRRAACALSLLGKPAVGPLISLLSHPSPKVRCLSADALGGMEDERVLEALLPCLGDVDEAVRCYTALALGSTKDERAVQPLINAVKDPVAVVRLCIAHSLGILGSEAAVDTLIEILSDENKDVREAGVWALEKISKQDLGEDPEAWKNWWEERKRKIEEFLKQNEQD